MKVDGYWTQQFKVNSRSTTATRVSEATLCMDHCPLLVLVILLLKMDIIQFTSVQRRSNTFSPGGNYSLESCLFHFDKDLYFRPLNDLPRNSIDTSLLSNINLIYHHYTSLIHIDTKIRMIRPRGQVR